MRERESKERESRERERKREREMWGKRGKAPSYQFFTEFRDYMFTGI